MGIVRKVYYRKLVLNMVIMVFGWRESVLKESGIDDGGHKRKVGPLLEIQKRQKEADGVDGSQDQVRWNKNSWEACRGGWWERGARNV